MDKNSHAKRSITENIKERIRSACQSKLGLTTVTLLSGIAAGVLNGFLGSGGGIILIFIMNVLLPNEDPRDTFATAVISILPMSAVSAYFYFRNGEIAVPEYSTYYASALIGGIIGAILLNKISTKLLKTIFAVLMIWAGFRSLTA